MRRMLKKGEASGPSNPPTSNTGTMCGSSSRAVASASRRKRAASSGLASAACRIIFNATSRPGSAWNARYTTPIPPRPNSSRNS